MLGRGASISPINYQNEFSFMKMIQIKNTLGPESGYPRHAIAYSL